eukprot:TRINITY_DN4024_c0_g1_i2.p1 TRINITY_DN4024_c0_g1~~TRINITY_DN4024_c0_g1_i2.p1  ORF type:complete len:155 (-),score=28.07 TRINITY_DN4024_c0_g1_i2:274-738(-)
MNECAKPPLPDANSRAIKIEMRPLVQPRLISKGELQEKYSRLVDGKLRSLEKALRVRSKDTLDDQQIASYIFDGAKSKIKRSSSFLSISPSIDCESEAPYAKSVVNSNSTVENDIATLNKLSAMNMGARYELLNANKMMVDLDLELVRVLIMVE